MSWVPDDRIIQECGKMQFLDRLLVKFFKTGHRVLLFSTMTKQLDLMEKYLQWREVDGVHYYELLGHNEFMCIFIRRVGIWIVNFCVHVCSAF